MRIKNLPSIESMDGSQDALVIEQTDGSEDKSRKVSPAQIKQYVLGEIDEVPTEDSDNLVKSGGIFSTMAVPKYDSTNRREYFEGGAAFDGNIDSSPTAGSNNAVASGGTKTYVDNAVSAGVSDLSSMIDTKKVRTVRLNKNQSATISANVRDYWAMMAVCYIPGEGGRLLGFVYTNGTGEVKNLWNGNVFSSSYVDFTFGSTSLTVTAKNYNGYVFTFIVTPPAIPY